jgi:phosphoenolpyruvate carboxykinase (GTP)
LPTETDLDTDGLNVDAADMHTLLSIDAEGWSSAIPQIRDHFAKFGAALPDQLVIALDTLEANLAKA